MTDTTAAPSGPITLDQFAAELTAEQEKAAAPVEEEEEKPTDAEAVTEEEVAAAEELEAEAEGEEEEETEAEPESIPDPPQSWSKDDREAWNELTPKAREVVLRRESDRDKAISQAVQKASEAVKFVQQLATRTEEIAYLAEDQFEKRWQEKTQGPIQWAQLARSMDPAEYQALRAEYETEKAAKETAAQRASEQSQLAYQAFVAEEFQKLGEIAPELADPKEGQSRREKVFSWLESQGVPRDVFKHTAAVELKIAWKAMRFDEMEAKAKEQAKLPRKNPTAAPVKAVRAAGSGDASPQRNLQALSQKLSNAKGLGAGLDAFAQLMTAEQEQAARKQARRP